MRVSIGLALGKESGTPMPDAGKSPSKGAPSRARQTSMPRDSGRAGTRAYLAEELNAFAVNVADADCQLVEQRPIDVPSNPADARVGASVPLFDCPALLQLAGARLDAPDCCLARFPDNAGRALGDPAHRVRNVGCQHDRLFELISRGAGFPDEVALESVLC